MMNINDEDNIDLGASTNYHIQTRLSNTRGTGVNAISRADMAFAASDPLSELVWSPNNGLSLKCADSNLAVERPFLLWNVGPRAQGSRDDEGKLSVSQIIIDADAEFGNKATLVAPSRSGPDTPNDKMEEEARMSYAIQKGENGKDDEEENLCSPDNVQVADIAESSKKDAGLNTLPDEISDSNADMAINEQFSIKLITKALCSKISTKFASSNDIFGLDASIHSKARVCSVPNLQSLKEPEEEVTSSIGETNKNKTGFSREYSPPTDSRIRLYREKGKEKVVSNNEDDKSHGSLESCNSAGLFSKGVIIKRKSSYEYDQDVIVESKRTKKQIQESPYRSSFMNWISNMVKGLSDSNYKQENSSSHLADDVFGKNKENNLGFQTVFQSLYCQNTKIPSTGVQKEKDSVRESKELTITEKTSLGNVNSCKQIVVSNKQVNTGVSIPLATRNMPEKRDASASLWITRFNTTKTSMLENSNNEFNSTTKTSVFARRLDALRHIKTPHEKKNALTCTTSCFFCGKNGHDLRKCPEVTKTELEGLLVKFDSLDKVEESPSTASNLEYGVKENQSFPLEIFNAIRKLRLSRGDILRWMNSDKSLSDLNGFFLRLRLGKSEAGTSYHVAFITGDTREHIGCMSKKSIMVDVGGIESSVGIQYVSNHDFLEDEIKAWWCIVMKNGRKIPSLDELNAKLNDKKSFGL